MTGPRSQRLRAWLGLLIVLFSAAGCGSGEVKAGSDKATPLAIVHGRRSAGLHGTLVRDPPLRQPRGDFRDTDGDSFRFTSAMPGQVTALYFGFTNCDDVCPTTMADLATARRLLPSALATHVRVVFVTVDPQRDTPRLLRRWLDRYDPSFLGLRATPAVVHAAERSLYASPSGINRSPHSPQHGPGGHKDSTYQVNHTGSVYVFGPGAQSVIYTGGTVPREYAADFRHLLASTHH